MINVLNIILISLLMVFPADNPFGNRKDLGKIDYKELQEISGMVAGRVNSDVLWIHNDSGNESEIFAVDKTGKLKAVFTLKDIKLIDAEDIAIGSGPVNGLFYIYLADIGDNSAVRAEKTIYRFPEPEISKSDTVLRALIDNVETYSFSMPDGNRDCETIMIDELSSDIIMVSKREDHARVYQTEIPSAGSKKIEFKKIAELPFGNEGYTNSGVTGGDMSLDGMEILLKTYGKVYYFRRDNKESLSEVFSKKPIEVDYLFEPQSEAICFGNDNEGFYTTSEVSPLKITPHLYFYPRVATGINRDNDNMKNNYGNNADNPKLEIFDYKGNKLTNISNMENLSNGMYFLLFTFDDTAYTKKVLVHK